MTNVPVRDLIFSGVQDPPKLSVGEWGSNAPDLPGVPLKLKIECYKNLAE